MTETRQLEELADVSIRRGVRSGHVDIGGDIPVFTARQAATKAAPKYYTSDEAIELSRSTRLELGDLLLDTEFTVGGVAVVDEDLVGAACATFTVIIRVGPMAELSAKYLGLALSSPSVQAQLKHRSRGTIHRVSLDDVNRLKVWVPSRGDQDRMTEQFAIIDSALSRNETVIESIRELREVMLVEEFANGGAKEW